MAIRPRDEVRALPMAVLLATIALLVAVQLQWPNNVWMSVSIENKRWVTRADYWNWNSKAFLAIGCCLICFRRLTSSI